MRVTPRRDHDGRGVSQDQQTPNPASQAAPQTGQVSMSMPKTRLRRRDQVNAMDGMYAGFAGAKTGHGGVALGGGSVIGVVVSLLRPLTPFARVAVDVLQGIFLQSVQGQVAVIFVALQDAAP